MVRIFSTIALLITPLQLFSYPTPVDFDGSLLRWDLTEESDPILIKVSASNDEYVMMYEDIVLSSANLWSEVATSFFVYEFAEATETEDVLVKLVTDYADAGTSAGFTVFDGKDDNGPVHCTIEIAIPKSGFSDISKTTLHELGHCIGLGHSLIPESIMSYHDDENRFALSVDDEAAISRLYPINGAEPGLPPGCAIGPTQNSMGGVVVLILFPIVLMLRRKLHSKKEGRQVATFP